MSSSREEVIKVLSDYNLKDYGARGINLARQWAEVQTQCLAVGLQNSDNFGLLLQLIDTEEGLRRLITGMEAAALVLGAGKKLLYIPEYAQKEKERIEKSINAAGIELRTGLIDVREHEDSVICHMVTMLSLADCLAGTYEEGVYVSVNGGPLKKESPDTLIGDLADPNVGKGVLAGNRVYKSGDWNKTLKEAEVYNGVLRFLDGNDCMVQLAEKDLLKNRERSCGKCVFCREGLLQLQAMFKDTAEGKGRTEYPDLIKEIGLAMKYSCLCSLGQSAAELALVVLEQFSDEYSAHNKRKKCPAGVCFVSSALYIDPAVCTGCMECMDQCPVDCIEGRSGYIHMIDSSECTRCRECMKVCEAGAIIETDGKLPKLPERLVRCGKFKKR